MRDAETPIDRDVERYSNRIARGVRRRAGSGPIAVGLAFADDARLATAVLGVLKAGGRPTLLEPSDAGVEGAAGLGLSLVITDRGAGDVAFALAGPTCTVAVDEALVEGESGDAPPPAVAPEAAPRAVVHRRPETDAGGDLVQLQEGESDRWPLFVLHDLDGRANRHRRLAIELGDDQPVYGVESPFLAGLPVPVDDRAALAERYAAGIAEVQPDGPLHVAGVAFGGLLAVEVACRLREQGRDLAFVGVVDAGPGCPVTADWRHRPPPSPWLGLRPPADPAWSLRRRVRYYGSIAKRTPGAFAHHVAKRTGLDRYTLPVEWWIDQRRLGRVRPSLRPWYAWRHHWELCGHDWVPPTVRSGLWLFWSNDLAAPEPTLGWGPHVEGPIEVHPLHAPHRELLADENVGALAGALRRVLDRTPPVGP